MALRTKLKLFRPGTYVYVIHELDTRKHIPRRCKVERVAKGRIYVRDVYTNEEVSVNANDRSMSFTYAECEYLCELLDGVAYK